MVEVKVKAVNHDYFVVCRAADSFLILDELEKKLCACAFHSGDVFKAFFVFECAVDEAFLIEVLKVCQKTKTMFLGVKETKKDQALQVYKEKLYAGSQVTFFENTLICTDIPKDCFVVSHASLYVVGKVYGCIDFLHPECECYASGYENARIRIFDTNYQNLTFFCAQTIYYENQNILFNDQRRLVYGL